jgi:hypothetical protein
MRSVRNDIESQRKFAEIKLRACVKIGKIVTVTNFSL